MPDSRSVVTPDVQVLCPCGSGQVVACSLGSFHDTTCDVEACSSCRGGGVRYRTMRKSYAYDSANQPVFPVGSRHQDGLVLLAGAL